MQDISERVERKIQTQTQEYVLRIELLLYILTSTQKDFHYVHTGPSTKGPPLRNYNSTLGVHYFSLKHNHLYTRRIGTKLKQRKDYNLGDLMITNNIW